MPSHAHARESDAGLSLPLPLTPPLYSPLFTFVAHPQRAPLVAQNIPTTAHHHHHHLSAEPETGSHSHSLGRS